MGYDFRVKFQQPSSMGLNAWRHQLARLPLAEALEEVCRALAEPAAQRLDLRARLARLEDLAPALIQVLGRLEGEVRQERDLGAERGGVGVQSGIERLCVEAVRAHRGALEQRAATTWVRRRLSADGAVRAAYRLFGFVLVMLNNGIALPPGLWRSLHHLYRDLRQEGLHQTQVPTPGETTAQPGDLEGSYKALLLVSLAPQADAHRATWREILALLPEWAMRVDLRDCAEGGQPPKKALLVETDADRGPQPEAAYCGDCRSSACLLLDARRLDAYFVQILGSGQGADPSARLPLEHGGTISPEALGLMKSVWVVDGEDQASFLQDAASIARWIQSLHLFNVRESTRQVYLLLRDANRQPIPAKRRLGLLEQLSGPLAMIFANLRRQYGEIGFPLSARTRKVVALSVDLFELLLNGYDRVLTELERPVWLCTTPQLNAQRLAMHRILALSSGELLTLRMVNRKEPAGFWQRLHRTYELAEQQHWTGHRQTLTGLGGDDEERSLEQRYKQLLLSALAPLFMFSSTNPGAVTRYLGGLAEQVRLISEVDEGFDPKRLTLRVEPGRDHGPLADARNSAAGLKARYLDLDAVRERIDEAILDLEQRSGAVAAVKGLGVDTLRVLYSAFEGRHERHEKRRPINLPLETVFSIAAIHHVLSEASAPEQEVTPVFAGAEDGLAQGLFVEEIDYQQQDVWNSAYPELQPSPEGWMVAPDTASYRFFAGRMRDFSHLGARVELADDTELKLHVGDVTGLKGRSGISMAGFVRWIDCADGADQALSFGVRFLIKHIEPAALVAAGQDHGGLRLPCLAGEALGGQGEALLLPAVSSIRKLSLNLERDGRQFTLRLFEPPLEASASFMLFRYEATLIESAGRRGLLRRHRGEEEEEGGAEDQSVWELL